MSGPGYNFPKKCLVTGGSGFVGQRLVEMLVERGATLVVSFDIVEKPEDALDRPEIIYIKGDLTNIDDVRKAARGVDCVFHIAALVGPYHPKEAYKRVNFDGTKNVLDVCNELHIKKIVMSSSPSTRFPYPDPNVNGLTEDELAVVNRGDFPQFFLQPYAETKAQGEKLIRDACGSKEGDLLTIAVAPHQVYGPRDGLFLPNLLDAAGSGKLRIFGHGNYLMSFCHVDNYCHGLILGSEALYPGSVALGKYYVITDDVPVKFWHVIDQAAVAMGFSSMLNKFHIPVWLIMSLGYLCIFFGKIYSKVTGTPEHIVNYHVKLNPFAVKMLVINRYFNIEAAKRDLHYKPLIQFNDGWKQTIEWFKLNWLPKYNSGKNNNSKTK